MSQREKIIAGVLALMVVVAFLTTRKPSLPVKAGLPVAPQAAPSSPASPSPATVAADKALALIVEKLDSRPAGETLENIRSPFQKFDLKLVEKSDLDYSDLVLSGIITGEDPVTVINDQILKVGSRLANFEVKEINPNEVVLTRGVEKYVLKLSVEP